MEIVPLPALPRLSLRDGREGVGAVVLYEGVSGAAASVSGEIGVDAEYHHVSDNMINNQTTKKTKFVKANRLETKTCTYEFQSASSSFLNALGFHQKDLRKYFQQKYHVYLGQT